MENPNALSLRALVVSDVHLAVKKVAAIAEWAKAESRRFDVVFCLGDVADLDDSDQASRAAVTAAEGDVGTILSVLESIRCHVVYIPGNHDPVTTFNLKAPPRLSSYSYNIHNKRFSLLPGLCVVGFGGSTTAHRGDDVVWNGFPYTEEQVKTGVSHLLRQPSSSLESSGGDSLETGMGDSDDTGKVEETDRPAEQVILLTHLGPRSSGTAVDTSDLSQAPICAGSTALDEIVKSPLASNVLVNLHGHTHNSAGQSFVGKLQVVNPGSVRFGGRFAALSLRRHTVDDEWFVESVELRTTG